MSELLDYYLTGGKLRIGKREAALELLRKDSVLRPLLSDGAGELKALLSETARAAAQGDDIVLDFSQMPARKLHGDPAIPLGELKRRYPKALGGMLYFRCVYSFGMQNYYVKADLEEDLIELRP